MLNVVASSLGFIVVAACAARAEPRQETPPAQAPVQTPPEPPAQTPPKLTPPKLPGDAAPTAAPKPLVGSDGQPLVPGVIPANTDPAAREAWQRALAATVLAGGERAPIRGFELTIDARVVIASVDTYLRFAEATHRLDLHEHGTGLFELPGEMKEKGAKGIGKGVIEGVKEGIRG